MHNEKEGRNSSEDLRRFTDTLIEEYEYKLTKAREEENILKNRISETEALIQTIKQVNNKSISLFSPNSNEYSIKDYKEEIDRLKSELDNIKDSQIRLEENIAQIKELKQRLIDCEPKELNLGINILELQEQERNRIARDLHDSTVQSLTSLIHKCELCFRLVDMDPVRTKLELTTMSNTLKFIINEIREIIYNLRPMSLEDLGLMATVERYANQIMITHDIKINICCNKEREILPIKKLSIFRIIQEACSNAIKHAEAKSIEIHILYEESSMTVTISDNGKGFDAESKKDCVPPDYSGYGLSIMNERINLLSGSMKIHSKINEGTKVVITVPISKSEGEE